MRLRKTKTMATTWGEQIHFQGRQLCQNWFVSFWKGVCSKRKDFVPKDIQLFPLRVDFLSDEVWNKESEQEVIKVIFLLKRAQMYHADHSS